VSTSAAQGIRRRVTRPACGIEKLSARVRAETTEKKASRHRSPRDSAADTMKIGYRCHEIMHMESFVVRETTN